MYRPLTVTTIVLATAASALLATPAHADPLTDDITGGARANQDTSVEITVPPVDPGGSLRISAPASVTLAPGNPAGLPYDVNNAEKRYSAYVPTRIIDDRSRTSGWTASVTMTDMTGPTTIPASAFNTRIPHRVGATLPTGAGITTNGEVVYPLADNFADIPLGTGPTSVAQMRNLTGAASDTTQHQALSIGKSNFPQEGGTYTAKMTNSVL